MEANFRREIVPLEKIEHDVQHFGSFDLKELVRSIETAGLIYEPIVEYSNGRYIVRDGHHRVEAFRNLGKKEIPCKVFDENPVLAVYYTFDANLVRRQLSAPEVKQLEVKKKELLVRVKNQILAGKDIDLAEEDLVLLSRLKRGEYERLVQAIKKSVQEEGESRIKSLEEQLRRKEEELKKLKSTTVDTEKLREEIQKKLKEKEQEIRQKIMEEAASKSESEKLKLRQEIETLKAERDKALEDVETLNKDLAETTKKISQIKKEKEDLEREKKKLEEDLKRVDEIHGKMESELKHAKLEIKKLKLALDSKEAFVRDFAKPETVVFFLETMRNTIQTTLDVTSRVYSAIDSSVRKKASVLVSELIDMLGVLRDVICTEPPEPEVSLTPEEEQTLGIQVPLPPE